MDPKTRTDPHSDPRHPQPAGPGGITHAPMDALPTALAVRAREKWSAFSEAVAAAGLPPPATPGPDQWMRLFALSQFGAQYCIRHPAAALELAASGDLESTYPERTYGRRLERRLAQLAEPLPPTDLTRRVALLQPVLRAFRHREMVRIAWRDLSGRAHLTETMACLSDLADAVLCTALDLLQAPLTTAHGDALDHRGRRQKLVMVAMGKLGARELNFSSDIDLILAFPENGVTQAAQRQRSVSHEEYFTRLAQALIRLVGATTADGFVFRVDTRLRPFGENGPLVMSFDALEDYYQSQGREWERYAWIKARAVNQAETAGADLLKRLKPFVYRRFLDYGAFESLRDMKRRITAEVRRKGVQANIKTGPGGIREIEFFGQVFQLIRGGVQPALQRRGILAVLDTLAAQKAIPANASRQLRMAYGFLRRAENRLQIWADGQTHELPEDPERRLALAVSMGFGQWSGFSTAVEAHRERVHRHFNRLLQSSDGKEPPPEETAWTDLWHHPEEAAAPGLTADAEQQAECRRQLVLLRSDPATLRLSAEGRRRLDRLMPRMLAAVSQSDQPARVLTRIVDLLRTIQRRINYLSLLLENPSTLTHLVRLADASSWISTFLARHPVLLDELLDPRTLFTPPDAAQLASEITAKRQHLDPEDLEAQIQELCIFQQINTLRVAAADVSGTLALMRTSDHLTSVAETVVHQVLELSWRHLVNRHGRPRCRLGDQPCQRGFAVIAYGKLGGFELGYGSDLDLVFVHAGIAGQTLGGQRPVDNAQFFARLGQRVVHILTTHTAAGRLYEIDMRLRPSGVSGLLVSQIDGFGAYQQSEAWTWEHQALIRARIITGDPVVARRFAQIRRQVLTRRRDPQMLRTQVAEMRTKMRRHQLKHQPANFHIKQSPGGIVDIEFLVQYLVLRHAVDHPRLTRWTDNVRLLETLSDTGVLDLTTANLLKAAYLTYRAEVHRCNLQQQKAETERKHFGSYPRQVAEIWKARIEGDD